MASDWGEIKDACPVCGGIVKWYEIGADCRGNPESSGASCKANKCDWTDEQEEAFWSDLWAKKRAEYEKQKAEGVWDA